MNYQLTIDDYIGAWGYSKYFVRQQLAQYKGKHVDVKISSLGGELDHALDIRQQFIDHGDVTVHLSGFVASAATVIAMGAKHVSMNKYAFFLVHKCSNYIDIWGQYNSDQMQNLIDNLEKNRSENEKIDLCLAQLYSERTGSQVSEISDLLKEEIWLTAQEALDRGFIDEITDLPDDKKENLTPELKAKFNAWGIPVEGLPDSPEHASQSALDRILTAIRSIGRKDPAAATETPDNSKQAQIMKIKADRVAAVIDGAELSAENGTVKLTQEQVQKIDDHIGQLADQAEADKNTIADLNARIDALSKQPGDDTKDVKEDSGDDVTPGKRSLEMYNAVKDCL